MCGFFHGEIADGPVSPAILVQKQAIHVCRKVYVCVGVLIVRLQMDQHLLLLAILKAEVHGRFKGLNIEFLSLFTFR